MQNEEENVWIQKKWRNVNPAKLASNPSNMQVCFQRFSKMQNMQKNANHLTYIFPSWSKMCSIGGPYSSQSIKILVSSFQNNPNQNKEGVAQCLGQRRQAATTPGQKGDGLICGRNTSSTAVQLWGGYGSNKTWGDIWNNRKQKQMTQGLIFEKSMRVFNWNWQVVLKKNKSKKLCRIMFNWQSTGKKMDKNGTFFGENMGGGGILAFLDLFQASQNIK